MNSALTEKEQHTRKYKDGEIFKRLFKYVLKFKRKVIGLLILSVLVSLTGLGYPLLMAVIVGQVEALNWSGIFETGMALIGIVSLNFILKWIYQYGMATLSLFAISEIRSDLFTHIQNLSLRFYGSRSTGKIMSILTNDVGSVNNLVSSAIIQFISDMLTVIITLTGIIIISYQLTLFILLFAPLIGGVLYLFARKSREYWRRTRQTISLITSLLQESISGSKTVKAFVTEDQNIENFNIATKVDRDVNLSAAKLQAFLTPIIQLIMAFAIALVLVRGAALVQSGNLTIPKLVAYILLAMNFIGPFGNVANFYNTAQLAMAGGERILTVFDTKPDITEKPDAVQLSIINGVIEFKNVEFWYKEGIPVLKDISFKTIPNQRVAFVGFTGAGKTTLISLLSRFYDPQRGAITVDGQDLRDIEMDSLRTQMGIVLQDTYLFSGSVMDNIRYGKPSATDEEVIEAAKNVGAHKFIMKLIDGYNTEVRERGSLLSVGQRQLISFSRALLADPRILILDEATSSVDPYTEIKIQEALEKLLKGRNSFIIAHRLSTILNSDVICVLENGKIIQQGTHEQLVTQDGLYKHLYEMQFKKPSATLDELQDKIIEEETNKFVRT